MRSILAVLGAVSLAGCASYGPPDPFRDAVLDDSVAASIQDFRAGRFRAALAEKRWNEALDWAERLLKDGRLAKDGEEHLEPAALLMREPGARSPEFLRTYRERFDAEGRSSEDWKRFFFCSGMDVRADRLAHRWMDGGRPDLALEIWRALLTCHPQLVLPRAIVCAQAMLAAATIGDWEEMEHWQYLGPPDPVLIGSESMTLWEWGRRLRRARNRKPGFVRRATEVTVTREWEGEPEDPLSSTVHTVDLRYGLEYQGRAATILTIPGFLWGGHPEIEVYWCGSRLLWTAGEFLAGLLDPDTLRPIWIGPSWSAPIPSGWKKID